MKTASTMKFFIICAISMIFSTTVINTVNADAQLAYNKPELTKLKAPDGNTHVLNEYTKKGKWLVVVFWAYDCSACNAEAKSYNDLHNRHKNTDLELLGVSLDGWGNKEESIKFIRRHKLNFPNLIGENEAISAMFAELSGRELIGTPAIFIYDPKGELVAAEIGAVPASVIEGFVADNTQKN